MSHSAQVGKAFAVSILAGLCTILGILLVFIKPIRKANVSFIAYGNAFAAGTMTFVSLCEILQVKSVEGIQAHYCGEDANCQDEFYGKTLAIVYALFFTGCVVCFLLNLAAHKLLDHGGSSLIEMSYEDENNNDMENQKGEEVKSDNKRFCVMGLSAFMALTLHNIPEGLVTFLATYNDLTAGITLGIAVAIHNIPEGVAIVLPVYKATKSYWKSFLCVLVAGLAETFGGLIGFALIHNSNNALFEGISFGVVAGIMMWVVVYDMLPVSFKYAKSPLVAVWMFFGGAMVMALSLVLLNL